jgi:predicted nuclease of predicted toxin-antitoxin system
LRIELVSILRNLGHDVKVVGIDYPAGILDREVLSHAYKESRILLTNDKGDFGELIFRKHHPHSGVLLFRRMRSGDVLTKQERLSFVLKAYTTQLRHFLVVSPKSVRIRKTQIQKAA